MNTKQDRSPGFGIRAGLLLLVATALVVELWTLLAPRSFYEDFPAVGRGWVSALPPFNEHLVRDVGALNLALAMLLAHAAVVLERRLVQISLLAWLVYAVPHFVYHLTELGALPLFDDAANIAGLGLVVLLPAFLLFLTTRNTVGGADVVRGDGP